MSVVDDGLLLTFNNVFESGVTQILCDTKKSGILLVENIKLSCNRPLEVVKNL